jgi:hypothetical protein
MSSTQMNALLNTENPIKIHQQEVHLNNVRIRLNIGEKPFLYTLL